MHPWRALIAVLTAAKMKKEVSLFAHLFSCQKLLEFCGCQIPWEVEVGTSLVNSGEWGLMPVHGAGLVGKQFGIFLFKPLPSEKMAWLPAAFFSAVWFKKMPFF